jgi:hypothetical protein
MAYKMVVVTVLLCWQLSACNTINKVEASQVLQVIDLSEAGMSTEGAEFTLTKVADSCELKGTFYGEMGRRDYFYQFKSEQILKAHYIEHRYEAPITGDSEVSISQSEQHDFKESSTTERVLLETLQEIKPYIDKGNLRQCGGAG